MKLIIRIILVFLPFISALASSQDTLYVMRWGQVAYKVAVKDLDSISFENALLDRKSITEKIAKDNNYSIFYQGLIATGLVDSLKSDRDKKYSDKAYSSYKYSSSWTVLDVPAYKRYGNTLLMESDSVFRSYSINSLSDLKNYAASVYNQVYPEDAGITDVKNRRNSLNRFIAYHIINKRLSLSNLIDIYDTGHMLKTVDMNEYYETLCPNTLVEVSKIRTINKTNLINRNPDTGNAIQIVSGFNDSITYNGFYYGIDKILSYNPDVDRVLSNKRLRFDMASLFPELTNNGFKTQASTTYAQKSKQYYIPDGYLKNLSASVNTTVGYLAPFDAFLDYEGDEMFFSAQSGKVYDFTFDTPPVPAGNYEIRIGYLTNGKRGVAQISVDSIPTGAPVDFDISSTNPVIGKEVTGSVADDPYGYLNDKSLRNHGYMKGPACYTVPDSRWQAGPARNNANSLRRILGTYTFAQPGKHKISVQGLCNGEFQIDFIEFVPTTALESEDIY